MEFQGFQNSFPTFISVFGVIILIAISWWSYSKQKNISFTAKIGLAALRASALILLFFLLMNPFFYSSTEVEIDPTIAVFLDNSESIGISKGDYQGLESYRQLLNELNFENTENLHFEFYSIGENSQEFHPDSITANSPRTNLSDAVNHILEFEDDIKAAVFISDGIITYGKNPVFSAATSSIPLHTIALGDTSNVRDISVSNIVTNQTGYTNSRQNVEVEVSQTGFKNEDVTVKIYSGDEIIQEKSLSFDTEDQVKNIDFELELDEAGLQQYNVQVEVLPGEWTESNNSRSFSIDVLDSKVKVLDIAFEIHPDVKTVRSIIEQDINNELTTLTWLGDGQFIGEIPQDSEFNVVIIHGTPDQSLTLPILEEWLQLPTLYFSTGSSMTSNSDALKELELIEPVNAQLAKISLSPLLNANEHSVLELPDVNLAETPQLTSPFQTELSDFQSKGLFGFVYSGIERNDPVVAVMEQGNIRRAHVYSWDWYKWHLSLNEEHREFVQTLISNLQTWVATNPDDENLTIHPAKQSFTTFENPEINATLVNESGEKENDAIIELVLEMENGTTRSFNMKNTGNGKYELDLPRLSEGKYAFEAAARKGNREIGSKSGEFLISNSSTELTNTLRNDKLLKAISENSGGLFFTYDNVSGFWDRLRTAGIFESETETIEHYSYPVRSFLWFGLVLVLLSAEWMLRKYYSLP